MSRFTADDVKRLPGYEAHEDGNGYSFNTPTGRVAFRNALPMDEVFMHDDLGRLNITRLYSLVSREKLRATNIRMDDAVKEHIRLIETDSSVVSSMTLQRRNKPVISVITSKGAYIIDGNHRLVRRLADGCTFYRAYVLRAEILREIMVSFYKFDANGDPIDQAPQMARTIEDFITGSDRMWEMIGQLNGITADADGMQRK